ncbi:MAG: hypothetical protein ACRDI1_00865 [Actinomycetota bacterium]
MGEQARRYLVVANRTLVGDHLAKEVEQRLAQGEASFFLLVPATPPQEGLTFTEGQIEAIASKRLEEGLERFRGLGAEVDGAVGDSDPVLAVGDVLGEHSFDEVIISTLPEGASKWLRQNLPSQVERSFDLPVTHVVGE